MLICYNVIVVQPIPDNGGRCSIMLYSIVSFLASVSAGVVAYYICKWLDSKL
jgi:hypothetical protein